MRVRHRIPSIFNLSMVDVLCCALGCVILIWLINLRESKQHEEDAAHHKAEANSLLEKQKSQIADLEKQRADVQAQADAQATAVRDLTAKLKDATDRAASLQADLDARGKELAAARANADDLSRQLADAGGKIKGLTATADLVPGLRSDLRKAQDQYAADEAKLLTLNKDLSQRAVDLDDTARKLLAAQKEADARVKDLDDANKKLTTLQTTKSKLESDLDDRNKELTQFRTFKDKFAADEDKVLVLTKDLADLRKNAESLETEKTKWQKEAARVKAEADNRFAGILLSGKRVVFLVDMSGSMDYVDENTKAPDKWLGVRTTVARIMRSLPELEKFQLITYSDDVHFPLGAEGKWIDYDKNATPDLVLKTLEAVKPDGGTNIYNPMQTAFGLRAQGLDAVYLLSDGLPNLGKDPNGKEITYDTITAQRKAKLAQGMKQADAENAVDLEDAAVLSKAIRDKLKADWNRDLAGQPRVHINTVGFFYESPDVGAFLWALARENDGSFVGMSKP